MLARSLMRLSLLVLIALSCLPVWSQSGSTPLITDVQVTTGDSTYRFLYLYGDGNLKTLETKYVLHHNEWIRREQSEWIYSDGKCESLYVRKWINYQWVTSHKIEYGFNNNKQDSETHFECINGAYTPLNKHLLFYNGEKLVAEADSVYQMTHWMVSSRNRYKYSATTEKLDTIFFTKYNADTICFESYIEFKYNDASLPYLQTYAEKKDGSWINSFQTKTFYLKDSNRKSYQVVKTWNNKTKKWNNSHNITYNYDDAGNIVKETFQQWKSQAWENDLRNEYFYNDDHVLDKKITYKQIYDDFRPISSVNYTEFQYNKASLIEANNEFWGGEKGSTINTFIPFQFNNESVVTFGSKIKISYIPVDNTGIIELSQLTFKGHIEVYPNPSTAIFYFNTKKYNVKSWVISDISGKILVQKSVVENSGVIDLGDFKSGIYILQVKTNEGTLTQKLIKI